MAELTRRWAYLMSVERRAAMLALALLILVLLTLFCLLGYVVWQQNAATASVAEPLAVDVSQQTGIDAFQAIQTRGYIIAGVSPENPPFAYNDNNFNLRGFDIALIEEIGERLGLQVQFQQLAFDGLADALQIGQIDLAAGGIAITPERTALVDFTNPYYFGEDATVAAAAAPIQITRVQDLANYRVGVVRGSAFESWLRDALVTPGLMPNQRLERFDNVDAALNGLLGPAPVVDLVVIDLLPAQTAVASGPVKIIARGMNPQSYALAVAKNTPTWLATLNQVLLAMEADGTLAALQQEYLQVAVVLPTAIPPVVILPTPTFMPPQPTAALPVAGGPACQDGMEFVSDLNYPDNGMAEPPLFIAGQVIRKGWRIRNTGDCIWDSGYRLTYVASEPEGAAVSGNPVALSGRVPPGGEVDVTVSLTAPPQSGRYQSYWALVSPREQEVGERLWVGMQVDQPAGLPPAVLPRAGDLPAGISLFTVEPRAVQAGQCVTLTWQHTLGAASAQLYRGATLILPNIPASGTFIDCPPTPGAVEYRLAGNAAGTAAEARSAVTVQAGASAAATPVPPAAGTALIQAFNAENTQVVWGTCVRLSWSFSSQPGVLSQLYRGGEEIGRNLTPVGAVDDCPPDWGVFEYRLEVSSSQTGITDSTVTVNVLPLSSGSP